MTGILQETLAPRAARNKKSYVEDPQLDKNNNKGKDGQLKHKKSQGGVLAELWKQLIHYHWLMEQ